MWWSRSVWNPRDLWEQSHSALILLPSQSSKTGFDPRPEASLFVWNRYSETASHSREQSQEERHSTFLSITKEPHSTNGKLRGDRRMKMLLCGREMEVPNMDTFL